MEENKSPIDTTAVTDVEACISFIANFVSKHGENHIPFHICSLREAIVEVCFAPVQSRKIIALYFHNENDPFSKMFCPALVSGDIRNALENTYYLLGWDVGNEAFHKVLKKSLDENIDFEIAQSMISEKHAALLIVYPIENSVTIFSMLHGEKVTTKDVLIALQEIGKSFQIEIKNEIELEKIKKNINTQNDIGSKEFQQLMYDRLGDRDYDSFEYDEHEYLKQKIGFSKYGPPTSESGYDRKQNKRIEETYKQIRLYNNKYAKWQDHVIVSIIYNCLEPIPEEKIARAKRYQDYNPNTDIMPVALYVIRKCKGSKNPCRIYIDSDNRVYNAWRDYIEDNKLQKCTMVLPKDGRYIGDGNGRVILERHLSPTCGIGHAVLKGADIATTLAGLASGGVIIAAMIPALVVAPVALTVAAVTGLGVGVYSAIRSAVKIYDRHVHGESMSFANSEARGAYINIVAGTLGFVGAGAATAVTQLTASGINVGQGAGVAINTIGMLNLGANGVSMANSTIKIVDDWITKQQAPSLLTRIQLHSSILFFENVVYNFKADEVDQTNILENYRESLNNNKDRKIFDKMVKEASLRNRGAQEVQMEVIAKIRCILNKAEMFAVLNHNKFYSKEGIQFLAEDGDIKLNGTSVDLYKFGSTTKTRKAQFHIDFFSMPHSLQEEFIVNVVQTINTIRTVFEMENPNTTVNYEQLISNSYTFIQLADTLIKNFSEDIQQKVLQICKAIMDELFNSMNFLSIVSNYFAYISKEPAVIVLNFVIDFLEGKMNEYKAQYEQEKEVAMQLPGFSEDAFNRKWVAHPDVEKRALVWFKRSVYIFVADSSVDKFLLCELKYYIMSILAEKVYDRCDAEKKRKKREKGSFKNPYKIACNVCGGYYYSINNSL